ncbi:site-specific tyrosine recombinase XerC [Megasphaera sp. BL7]|jgi:integrase|uniref:tyrosine-type recombinase/integrase n=1 Tax=unclassified Megasphaera TaxID=2626256 RepID=UPI00035781EE|nr:MULTISPECIES: tyrosine-type recombinase/integrase [unclassified Megasphaera]EPP17181.1 site-specific tyrosine recombinase XerC [Megasphaera sp. BL7]EPP18850.1 site-specific tyrosine recombinase XerC [Megasphaera sp. NM10]
MRNPNGYGCIKKLPGKRRRPFVFVVTEAGRQKPVEYFTNLVDAQVFQADYHRAHHHRSLPGHKITFAELYHRWLPRHTEDTQPSQSTLDSYRNAYQHLSTLHGMPVEELRYADYQRVIDDMRSHGLSYSSVKKVRSLISLLLKYANKIDLSTTNYAPLLSIGRNKPVRPHHTFSRQKINRLWAAVDRPGVDTVLILLYTGMRCGEMLQLQKADVHLRQRYVRITKSKTAAGIRIIPIHHRIAPLIESRMKSPGDALICDGDGRPYNYGRYCTIWRSVMHLIRANGHTTHDCRHTVATLLDNAGANETAKRRILGHAGGDITERVYTHKNLRQLRKCIELLK